MKQITTISELRRELQLIRQEGKSIGLVPTMGYLHAGHLSLVEAAREACDAVVMSIFVNPLQFGPNEDFERYPRDLARDSKLAESAGVDFLFTPSVEEMYPQPILTKVSVGQVSEPLCGRNRPGHFDGVATVVSKLFHIVWPDKAFFGQKDAQQLAVIEQMVFDLSMPITVVGCPIVREADGLALSSRNVYLNEAERSQATVLYRSLQAAQQMLRGGETSVAAVRDLVIEMINDQPLAEIDYVEVVNYPSMSPVEEFRPGQQICIAVAVRFGRTRLIDNVITAI
ncbi:pantoate--beta-alanine ligase [Brevibacillus massiliensis]|jgi:pantoate--beta-alanine ligase|uniref:pantoate--beta-alanine ligase n=1 Tax=Brevibacillus massiliensis TaxID=1118054 RepID=UPI0002DA5280|nr:pantoate--beta-alanine ligase [Brevibacillus massiliensis]